MFLMLFVVVLALNTPCSLLAELLSKRCPARKVCGFLSSAPSILALEMHHRFCYLLEKKNL